MCDVPSDFRPTGLSAADDLVGEVRAEERLDNAVLFPEENPFPVLRVTGGGLLLFANRAASRLLADWSCCPGDPVPESVRSAIAAALANGEQRELEISSGARDFSFTLVPISDAGYVNLYGSDLTGRKRAEARQRLLVESVSQLLASEAPQGVVESLCRKVMELINCEVFFNFLVDEQQGGLRLNACAGIADEEQAKVQWIDYGVAICGCAARDACCIVAEDILAANDPRTDLVKSFGIRAYACHPLMAQGRVLGTLSFGTRTKDHFFSDDLMLMKAVADHVAIAMERNQAERKLRDSESRYRELVETANSAIIRWKADGTVLFVNEYARRFFGYSDDEIVGRHVNMLVPDRDSAGVDLCELVGNIVAHPENYRSNINENICCDGRRVWMTWTNQPIFDSDGRAKEILAIGIDVTERILAETALSESEERFRQLAEAMPQLVWTADASGRVDYYNNRFREFKGLSQQADGSWEWSPVLHPDDLALTVEAWQSALHSGNTYQAEHRVQRADGTFAWFLSRAEPARDSQGRVVRWYGTATDINELKIAEQTVESARRNAEEASRAKSQFVANMSHEIRTPMTVFLMALEQLQQTNTDPAGRELLKLANKASNALRGLVDDILDFSRIEARSIELLEEPFDLRACICDVVEMFALAAKDKGIRLEWDVAQSIPPVLIGDSFRIRQVLINLAGNAVKFTAVGEVRISAHPCENVIELSVADTGVGIPEDQFSCVFDSFKQLDASFNRQHGGSGLGLAICKGLVELMGGAISVRNNEGGGCVFTFTVPLVTVDVKRVAAADAVESEAGSVIGPVNVLLAEDDPSVRKVITMALAHWGCQVEIAEDGRAALEKWRAGQFDVILMDLQMPGMNGLEATHMIRGHEAESDGHTAIIGLTAHVGTETQTCCLKAGMDLVLNKPIHLNELCTAIRTALSDRTCQTLKGNTPDMAE